MKAKTLFLILCASIAPISISIAAPPPNDDYTNATTLTGNDVTFIGSLHDATANSIEPSGKPFFPVVPPNRSVWWSWTATQSSTVTVTATSYSQDIFDSPAVSIYMVMAAYNTTNPYGHTNEDNVYVPPPSALAAMTVSPAIVQSSFTFNATIGSNYLIQFYDSDNSIPLTNNPNVQVTFHLVATNTPVILEPPVGQTVQPGASALFTVVADGIRPLSFQWCFNGTNLPQQTMAMLPLDNITMNQAGSYTVVISNTTGITTSAPVTLTVVSNITNPVLAAVNQGSNSFDFTLQSDQGHFFRIQSSTNLVNWSSEASFLNSSVVYKDKNAVNIYRSVVFNSNTTAFILPQTNQTKIFRAQAYAPPNEICNNNLKQIRFAKILWFRDYIPYNYARNQSPSLSDLRPYLPAFSNLVCPVSESQFGYSYYQLNSYLQDPDCYYVTNHILEEPRK